MDARLDTYDWREAFGYAGEPDTCAGNDPAVPRAVVDGVSVAPFTREDVAEIIAMREGEHDGDSWRIVVRLNDGRFAYLEAGCDYSGWD